MDLLNSPNKKKPQNKIKRFKHTTSYYRKVKFYLNQPLGQKNSSGKTKTFTMQFLDNFSIFYFSPDPNASINLKPSLTFMCVTKLYGHMHLFFVI